MSECNRIGGHLEVRCCCESGTCDDLTKDTWTRGTPSDAGRGWISLEELEASMKACAETLRQEWRDKVWISPEAFERVVQAAKEFARNETDSDGYVAELEHAMREAAKETP